MPGSDSAPLEGDELICYINGRRHLLPHGRGETTLLQYLRGEWWYAGG